MRKESFSLYIIAATMVEIIVPPPFIKVKSMMGDTRAVEIVASWFMINTAIAEATPQMIRILENLFVGVSLSFFGISSFINREKILLKTAIIPKDKNENTVTSPFGT